MKLVRLYVSCMKQEKGMNDFSSYMQMRAINGCSKIEAMIMDMMYQYLRTIGTPTLVINGIASPF